MIENFEDNYRLLHSWLNNVVNDTINDEILFLTLSNNLYVNPNIKEFIKKRLQLDKGNYRIFMIEDIASINEIKDNGNIIVLGHADMDVEKIYDPQHKILLCIYDFLASYIENMKIDSNVDKHPISIDERCIHYIEKNNPIDVIYTFNHAVISNHLLSKFYQESRSKIVSIFSVDTLQTKIQLSNILWYTESVKNDLLLLSTLKILTSELAVAIYRSTTMNFYASKTKIGRYYAKEFHIRSKSMHIPQSYRKREAKAYDLRQIYKESIQSQN